ncbi:548_t:CDS:1, partial [Paraglomus occultum]
RRSLPAHSQLNSQHHTQHTNPQRHSQGAYMEEANTKSLLYLLDKERAKRADLQKIYESTSQTLCDLQKTHQDDITTLESDIQVLQNALVKEAKVSSQLKQLLRDAHAKFTEEMQVWANKVAEMEEQGRELQKTFTETMNRLEQEEDELIRLREENQSLKSQLAGRPIESNNFIRPSLEDVYKVGSLEEGDDASTTTETKTAVDMGENSDGESMASYSKITELTDCISKLESELSSTKEKLHKSESIINDLQAEKQATVKQIEEKHEKQ